MSETRVGFVGPSNEHASLYLESLRELPVELACACAPNGEPTAGALDGVGSVPVYDDLEALFANGTIDAVWMTLPNRETPAAIKRAVEQGVHVYAEKTLARTAAELEPVVDAVEESDAVVVAAYQNRARAVPRELRSLAADGFFGDLRAVEARMIASRIDPYRDASSYVYDAEQSRGGILQWLGCHTIDLLHFVLEERVERVAARIDHGTGGVDVEDGATVQFELADSGAMGTLQAGYYDRGYDTYLGFHGSSGRAVWPGMATPLDRDVLELEVPEARRSADSTREVTYAYDEAPGYGGSVGLTYMRNFLDTIEGREHDPDLNATIRDSREVLGLLDAIYEAAETGKWVTVE